MIRVLHSVSNMDRAGIETMLMNYYRHIDRTKIQFDFLCNKAKPGDYDDEIISLGGHIYHSPGLNPVKYPKYRKFMQELLADNPEIQVLHAHNEAMALYALASAKKAGLPVRIFHAHNTWIEKDYKYPLKIFCKQFLAKDLTEQWSCGYDSAVFYFGRAAADSTVYYHHNAVECEKFAFSQQNRDKIREEFSLGSKVVIGNVGRFMAQKNHSFLVDAFALAHKQNPDIVLVLIGEGNGMEGIKEKVKMLGIEDSVIFTGSINNVYEWYSAMDAFVLPSLCEGFPVVGVEAQCSGAKCLFADTISEEVKILPTAEFLPLDVRPWADALALVSDDDRFSDAENAIKQAGYDIAIQAKELEEKYFSLISKG